MSTDQRPHVTIVVSTVDRVDSLRQTLDGLDRLSGVAFEIVVVVGPDSGATVEYLMGRSDLAAIVSNPTRNLSRSRNLGIDVARGEFVAFIDDDAYPSERWLADLLAEFHDDEVGAVGGEVFDYSGYSHQAIYSRSTRAGDASVVLRSPIRGLTETPAAGSFDYPMGTNLIARRSALLEIGGFDEQYDYFLDETDLVRRLLDAGWIVRVVRGGHVFHKFLPSTIRGEERIALDRRSILVNRAYFAARHQAPSESTIAVRSDFEHFIARSRAEIADALEAGIATEDDVSNHELAITEAELRLSGWLREPPRPTRHVANRDLVLRTREVTIEHQDGDHPHLAVVVSSPDQRAALERRSRELAQGAGVVRVITIEGPFSRVDLEGGIWRHRLAPSLKALPSDVPPSLDDPNGCATLAEEVDRISREFWPIDLVITAPDAEVAMVLAGRGFVIDGMEDATNEPLEAADG